MIAAVLLTSTVTFGQQQRGTSSTDMASLERKFQDAQYALSGADAARDSEFQEIRDELGYLRVKTRRGQAVTATERRNLSVRLDRYTAQLNASRTNGGYNNGGRDNNSGNRATGGYRDSNGVYRDRDNSQAGGSRSIPSGTEVDVRLLTRLSSKEAMVEDRVEATTLVDLYQGNDLLVPAGSVMVGQVTAVDKATRTDRKGSLTVAFTRLTVNGRTRDIRGSVTQAIEAGGVKAEAGRVGAGAGVGAIIGGILGGVKGAIAGVLIGGGGVLVATEGKDVDLDPGTVLRVRFDSVVPMTELRQ
ncbi:MAG: hypothetical protein ABI665_02285 [Vicinamibacterales bacterium]